MIAYKFLSRGAVGPFSGFRWPTPAGGAPGAWVEATGEVPEHGVHACRPADLPYWIDEELWIAELAGDVQATPHQIVAARGRLLEPIEAWRALARALGDDCAATLRARVDGALAGGSVVSAVAGELLRGYAADAEAFARDGNAAAAAYVAARASALLVGDPTGFSAERRRQAHWLEERLETGKGSPLTRA